jgi:hypothetical protein
VLYSRLQRRTAPDRTRTNAVALASDGAKIERENDGHVFMEKFSEK